MDFGATICKPLPECGICFYKNHCAAYLEGKQLLFPVKTKKTSVKERWFNYVIVKHHNKVAIRERTDKDIWQNLFEFVLIETDQKPKTKELLIQLEKNLRLTGPDYTYISEDELDQRLSHQVIHFRFFQLSLKQPISTENYQWISVDQLKDYPFPKSLQQYIKSSIS
jgi:A/G-specific adenine glycosylase